MDKENEVPDTRNIRKLTAGWGTLRWLQGATAKERAWLFGIIANRGGYGS